jgi:UDP-N-acetylmuramoylalanine--D-glutamate ligase
VADDGNAAARDLAAGEGLVVDDLLVRDWTGIAALLLSPGVPLTHPQPHPVVLKAQAAGVPIIGDIELFARSRPQLPLHTVVGITGTNGKSTTTALIHHLLVSAGRRAELGGNIGLPILDQEPVPAGGTYVLELSSFQLDLTHSLACDVAVITNMSADHLDRHGSMEGYAAAKERLFAMQGAAGQAVIGVDDPWCAAMAERRTTPVTCVSGQARLDRGVSVVDGTLYVDGVAAGSQADWPALQGPHNGQNVACAAAATLALGLPLSAILKGLASFPGLPHRMERIATVGGVLYVNDSKATNPTSTAPALGAYPAIHWIAGGKAKGDELDACLPYLKNVRAAYLIGAAQDVFATILAPHVPVVHSGTLEAAVAAAAGAAKPGEVVLLSPACASFDQFRDFEHRGAVFRTVVEALAKEAA